MATAGRSLEAIIREYHHLQSERRRAGPESSARRHQRSRLAELEAELERLLARDVRDEDERAAWREELHRGLPVPPLAAEQTPLAFRGRSAGGSAVEIRARADGDYDVLVDGVPADRLGGPIDFATYRDGDREYAEVFDAPAEALAALAVWIADPSSEPPLGHAFALLEDGLVDRHLGLTPRGRRAVRPQE